MLPPLPSSLAPPAGRAWLALRGDPTLRYRDRLLRNERLPARELHELADAKLRAIVTYAYDRVPWWRRELDERGVSPRDVRSQEDLPRLPILTKADVQTRLDELVARPLPAGARLASTGGSTGEPLRFYTTPEVKRWHDAAKLRFWRWAGLEPGVRHALLWGSTFDLRRLARPAARLERWAAGQLLLDAHVLDSAVLDRHAAALRRYRPRVIHGYAQAVHALARHCLDAGVRLPSVRAAITTAETLYDARRRTIERAFGCPVFDRYASRETALEVQHCERLGEMHVSIDTALLEVVDDAGRPVAPGGRGVLLVTDLQNRAMPLLRYRIEDVGTAGTGPCPCGRPFPTIRAVEGRVSDLVVLRDGRRVHPFFLMYLLYREPAQAWGLADEAGVEGVLQYRIVQRDVDSFEVLIRPANGCGPGDLGYVVENFRRYLGDVDVRLTFVDAIPTGPSGKRRYVVSEVAGAGEDRR